jgi:hypothetical protein
MLVSATNPTKLYSCCIKSPGSLSHGPCLWRFTVDFSSLDFPFLLNKVVAADWIPA